MKSNREVSEVRASEYLGTYIRVCATNSAKSECDYVQNVISKDSYLTKILFNEVIAT